MFGIVERIPERLEMLQYLLEEDNEIPSLSLYFKSLKQLDTIISQPSANRTTKIFGRDSIRHTVDVVDEEYLK